MQTQTRTPHGRGYGHGHRSEGRKEGRKGDKTQTPLPSSMLSFQFPEKEEKEETSSIQLLEL